MSTLLRKIDLLVLLYKQVLNFSLCNCWLLLAANCARTNFRLFPHHQSNVASVLVPYESISHSSNFWKGVLFRASTGKKDPGNNYARLTVYIWGCHAVVQYFSFSCRAACTLHRDGDNESPYPSCTTR